MKVTRIEIKDYNQFKDFTLDLTYPAGHEKAGQPLDKVCFIGQSGTGKTTLLNVINDLVGSKSWEKLPSENDIVYSVEIIYTNELPKRHLSKRSDGRFVFSDVEKLNNTAREKLVKYLTNQKIEVVFFPAEMIDRANQLLQSQPIDDPFKYISTDEAIKKQVQAEKERLEKKKTYHFSKDNPLRVWKTILADSGDYMVEELRQSQQITKALVKDVSQATALINQFKQWQKDNPNPFKKLADKINPIINDFYIEIKTEFDFERAEDLKFIKIQTLNGQEVPYHVWSTGTKQVILTATPLFKLPTDDSIVLMDEPERSLYPDIQRKIIPYYTGLAPNAQFFFATHSPLIASSFDPWEIVELKFDENGKVYQEDYLEGRERHIDNYKFYPKYLRWDSILTELFDLEEEGSEKRSEMLSELAFVNQKIKKLKKEGDKPEELEKQVERYKELAHKLAWKFDKNA